MSARLASIARFLSPLRARAAERLRALPEDTEGGSMVFGAITLFTLVLFIMLVYQVGMTSGDRLQLQGAADAGAYSGALVEADALESIAFANEGMCYVYYNELRYAVDAIVYGTLNEFLHHHEQVQQEHPDLLMPSMDFRVVDHSPPSNPQAPAGLLMGGDGSEFQRRYQAATQHASTLIRQGKQWLADLHDSERLVLAATPRIVAREAARIAGENGAIAVGVSNDLDDAFHLATGPADPRAALTDGHESGMAQNRVDDTLYRRYEQRPLGVDKLGGAPVARALPHEWFDPATGRAIDSNGGYYQIRLCWNQQDWNHDLNPMYFIHPLGDYQQYTQGPPNGHWHLQHFHILVDQYGVEYPSPPHSSWHVPPDMAQHQFSDPLAPSEYDDLPHHAVQRCPTCNAEDGGHWSGYTQIKKTRHDAERRYEMDGGNVQTEVTFNGAGDTFPRPIKAKARLFQAGVTVAAWMPGRGISTVFPASPFGMLAVASASIGLRDARGTVAVATNIQGEQVTFEGLTPFDLQNDPAMRNMMYASESNRGMKLGARLVPVGRDLTWINGDAGRGLRELLYGRAVWYGPDGQILDADRYQQVLAALQEMNKGLDVESSARAFVH